MIKENLCAYFENAIKSNWENLSMQDYDNGSLTYGAFGIQMLNIHHLYRQHGIEKGDKIALVGKNSIYWASVYIATVTYGAVIVPLLQDFTPNDIYKLVNHSDAKLLFASEFICKKFDYTRFENLRTVYYLDDCGVAFDYTNEFVAYDRDVNKHITSDTFKIEYINNSTLAAILYTSGTSGSPKGVMLTHNSLAANIRYAIANMPLRPGDQIVSFLPLAHCYGAAFEFLFPFCVGCTITFMGKLPSPQIILKAMGEIQPKLILSVPLVLEKVYKTKIKPVLNNPFARIITKIPLIRKLLYMKIVNSLNQSFGGEFKEIVIGGAKMNEEMEVFLKTIGFRFAVGYGMTECGPLISYDGWRTNKLHASGKPIDCLEVKIDAPGGRVGEILVKGENVMLGYYKNPEETAKVLDKDGWLHTGDLGIIDDDGYLFIKGRSKSMILSASGQNVYPEEIESKFMNFPLVAEVLVVNRDNLITALIYPDQDKIKKNNLKPVQVEKALLNYQKRVNEELPNYMQVKRLQIMEEEFVKTPKRNIKRHLYEN